MTKSWWRGALFAAVASVSCGLPMRKTPKPAPSDNIVITADQIAHMNVTTAFDVLRRRVPQLNFHTDRNGQNIQASRHGSGSMVLNDSPMLIVNGARMTDLDALAQIPAGSVDSITVMTGISGTTYYGTDATGGVIILRTKQGDSGYDK